MENFRINFDAVLRSVTSVSGTYSSKSFFCNLTAVSAVFGISSGREVNSPVRSICWVLVVTVISELVFPEVTGVNVMVCVEAFLGSVTFGKTLRFLC